jgi:hypothetical protein
MTAHILVEIIAPQFRKELLLQGKPLGLRKNWVCKDAAPILDWAIGKRWGEIERYLTSRNWRWAFIELRGYSSGYFCLLGTRCEWRDERWAAMTPEQLAARNAAWKKANEHAEERWRKWAQKNGWVYVRRRNGHVIFRPEQPWKKEWTKKNNIRQNRIQKSARGSNHDRSFDKSQLTEFREMLITIRDTVSALEKQGKSLDVVGSFLRL